MAEEAKKFDFGDVVQAITEKLVRRHPHVFGNARELSPDEVKALWSKIKADERRGESERRTLDGIPLALPALARALKLQDKAAKVGFDWEKKSNVEAKVAEELSELAGAADQAAAHEEIGDLLFALVNLARWLNVDPEGALRDANAKFERRFRAIEDALKARGKTPAQSNLAEMDSLWNKAKATEKR
jgi:ATP diphosphatase